MYDGDSGPAVQAAPQSRRVAPHETFCKQRHKKKRKRPRSLSPLQASKARSDCCTSPPPSSPLSPKSLPDPYMWDDEDDLVLEAKVPTFHTLQSAYLLDDALTTEPGPAVKERTSRRIKVCDDFDAVLGQGSYSKKRLRERHGSLSPKVIDADKLKKQSCTIIAQLEEEEKSPEIINGGTAEGLLNEKKFLASLPKAPHFQTSSRFDLQNEHLARLDRHILSFDPAQEMYRARIYGGNKMQYSEKSTLGAESGIYKAPLMPSPQGEMLSFIRMRDISTILKSQGAGQRRAVHVLQCFFRRELQKRRWLRQEIEQGRRLMVGLRMQFVWRYKRQLRAVAMIQRFQKQKAFRCWQAAEKKIFREEFLEHGSMQSMQQQLVRAARSDHPSRKRESRRLGRFIRWRSQVQICFGAWQSRSLEQARVAIGFRSLSRASVHFHIILDCVHVFTLKRDAILALSVHAQKCVQMRQALVAVAMQCFDIRWHNSSRQEANLKLADSVYGKREKERTFQGLKAAAKHGRQQMETACKFHRVHDSSKFGPVQGNARYVSRIRFLAGAFGALAYYFSVWWVQATSHRKERQSTLIGEQHFRRSALRQGLFALLRQRKRGIFSKAGKKIALKASSASRLRATFSAWAKRAARAAIDWKMAITYCNERRLKRGFRSWAVRLLWAVPVQEEIERTVRDICITVKDAADFESAVSAERCALLRKGARSLRANATRSRHRRRARMQRTRKQLYFHVLRMRLYHAKQVRSALVLQRLWRMRSAKRILTTLRKRQALKLEMLRGRGEDAAETLGPFAERVQRLARQFLKRSADLLANEIKRDNERVKRREIKARAAKEFCERQALVAKAAKAEKLKQAAAATQLLQRWYRGCRARANSPRALMNKAATLIQSAYSSHLSRRVAASICIQSWLRGTYDRRAVRGIRKQRRIAATGRSRRDALVRALRPILKTHARISVVVGVLDLLGAFPSDEAGKKVVARIQMLRQLRSKRAKLVQLHREKNIELLQRQDFRGEPRQKALQQLVRLEHAKNMAALGAVSAAEKSYSFHPTKETLTSAAINAANVALDKVAPKSKAAKIARDLAVSDAARAARRHAQRSGSFRALMLDETDLEPVAVKSSAARSQLLELAKIEQDNLVHAREKLAHGRNAAAVAIQAAFRGKSAWATYQRERIRVYLLLQDPALLERLEKLGIKGRRDQFRTIRFLNAAAQTKPVRTAKTLGSLSKSSTRKVVASKTFSALFGATKSKALAAALRSQDLEDDDSTFGLDPEMLTKKQRRWIQAKKWDQSVIQPAHAARLAVLDEQLKVHRQKVWSENFAARREALVTHKARSAPVDLSVIVTTSNEQSDDELLKPQAPKPALMQGVTTFATDIYAAAGFWFSGAWKDRVPYGYGRAFDFDLENPACPVRWSRAGLGSLKTAVGTWRDHGQQMSGVFQLEFSCGSSYVGQVDVQGVPRRRGKLSGPSTALAFVGLLDLETAYDASASEPGVTPTTAVTRRRGEGPAFMYGFSNPLKGKRFECDADYPSWRLNEEWDLEVDRDDGDDHPLNTVTKMDPNLEEEEEEEEEEGKPRYSPLSHSFYDGEWASGCFEGKGELELCNGTYYIGQFRENLPSGFGEVTYSDSSTYAGGFLMGKRSGIGRYEDASVVYEGAWLDDAFHGFGRLVRKNDVSERRISPSAEALNDLAGFQGPFSRGLPHGRGLELIQVDQDTFENLVWRPGIWENGKLFRYLSASINVHATEDFIKFLTPQSSTPEDEDASFSTALAMSILERYESRAHLELAFRVPEGVDGENALVHERLHDLQHYWRARRILEQVDGNDKNAVSLLRAQGMLVRNDRNEVERLMTQLEEQSRAAKMIIAEEQAARAIVEQVSQSLEDLRFDFADRLAECETGIVGALVSDAGHALDRLTPRHVASLLDGYVSRPPIHIRRAFGFVAAVAFATTGQIERCRAAFNWIRPNSRVDPEAWRAAVAVLLNQQGEPCTSFFRQMAKCLNNWKTSMDSDHALAHNKDEDDTPGGNGNGSGNGNGRVTILKCNITRGNYRDIFNEQGVMEAFILDPRHDPERMLREGGADRFQNEALYALWRWILAWFACSRIHERLEPFHAQLFDAKQRAQQAKCRFEIARKALADSKAELDALEAKVMDANAHLASDVQRQREMKARIDICAGNIVLSRAFADAEKRVAATQSTGPEYLVLDWDPADITKTEKLVTDAQIELGRAIHQLETNRLQIADKTARSKALQEAIDALEASRAEQTARGEQCLAKIKADHLEALHALGGSVPSYMFVIGRILCVMHAREEVSWAGALELFAPTTFDELTGRFVTAPNARLVPDLLSMDKHQVVYRHSAGFMHHAVAESGLDEEYVERHLQRGSFSTLAAQAANAFCVWILAMENWAKVEQSIDPFSQQIRAFQIELADLEERNNRLLESKRNCEETIAYRKALLAEIHSSSA